MSNVAACRAVVSAFPVGRVFHVQSENVLHASMACATMVRAHTFHHAMLRCMLTTHLMSCSLCVYSRARNICAGVCTCTAGWTGPHCSEKQCPSSCSSHGACLDGTCACADDWTGDDCSIPASQKTIECPNRCSGHGMCYQGLCHCHAAYGGPDCAMLLLQHPPSPPSRPPSILSGIAHRMRSRGGGVRTMEDELARAASARLLRGPCAGSHGERHGATHGGLVRSLHAQGIRRAREPTPLEQSLRPSRDARPFRSAHRSLIPRLPDASAGHRAPESVRCQRSVRARSDRVHMLQRLDGRALRSASLPRRLLRPWRMQGWRVCVQ